MAVSAALLALVLACSAWQLWVARWALAGEWYATVYTPVGRCFARYGYYDGPGGVRYYSTVFRCRPSANSAGTGGP